MKLTEKEYGEFARGAQAADKTLGEGSPKSFCHCERTRTKDQQADPFEAQR